MSNGSLDIVEILVSAGAEINTSCDDGRTPLHAALQFNSSSKIAQFLIENNANAKCMDNFGRNIHYFSAIYGHSEIWASFFEVINKSTKNEN